MVEASKLLVAWSSGEKALLTLQIVKNAEWIVFHPY
jgi:hypothetical protein